MDDMIGFLNAAKTADEIKKKKKKPADEDSDTPDVSAPLAGGY